MLNLRMQEKLDSGECINVLDIGKVIHDGVLMRLYQLSDYIDGKDYCDADREQWIWSIGKHKVTGEIFASTDTRYYSNPDYECLWLR